MRRFYHSLCRRLSSRPSSVVRSYHPAIEGLEGRWVPAVVTYHGGNVIPNVQVENIFLGNDWQVQGSVLNNWKDALINYMASLTGSPYMDLMGQYGVGRGSVANSSYVNMAVPAWSYSQPITWAISDGDVRTILDQQIQNPYSNVGYPNADKMYMVWVQPGVESTLCIGNNWCGYHSSFTDSAGRAVYYAVIPYRVGNPVISDLSPFNQYTEVGSHELAETVTNPSGGGFYGADQGEEVGDLANAEYGNYNGWIVQSIWSQQYNGGWGAAVLPSDALWLRWVDPATGSWVGGGSGSTNVVGGMSGDDSFDATPPANLQTAAYVLVHSDSHAYQFITDAYQRYLHRTPDAAGLNAWLTAMHAGLSDEHLEADFIGSPEYIAGKGGTQAWIRSMYQDLLGRAPGAGEVQAWTNYLAAHPGGEQAVAYGFAASAEREGLRVRDDYVRYLDRYAGKAEVDAWVKLFTSSRATNEDLLAGFVGSAEYYNNYQKGRGDRGDWVRAAYDDLFSRAPSTDELSAWEQYLS